MTVMAENGWNWLKMARNDLPLDNFVSRLKEGL